jgi:predicted ATPase
MADAGQLVESMHVRNFACVRDVDVKLTPLHAFIGPNDSGKSTLLRALRTALHLSTSVFVEPEKGSKAGGIQPFAPGRLEPGTTIRLVLEQYDYSFTVRPDGKIEETTLSAGQPSRRNQRPWLTNATLMRFTDPLEQAPSNLRPFAERLSSRFVHLIPGTLREPSDLIPDDGKIDFRDEFGRGLPGILDAVLNRGDDSFLKIVEGVRGLFPTIKTVRLRPITRQSKVIDVELTSGVRVPAAFVSEGMLFYLAFAALQYLEPVGMLLVEEPENGLHPARIADVMRILREISKVTQVVLATHSPLVINELQGDEVSLVTRDAEAGTQVKLLSETPNFAERSKVYALGELWLSYANGVDEAPLLHEG